MRQFSDVNAVIIDAIAQRNVIRAEQPLREISGPCAICLVSLRHLGGREQVLLILCPERRHRCRYGNGIAADLGDPVKIAMEINRAMNDYELLPRLRQGALVAKQELNWCVEEVKLLAIYKSLLT